MVLCVFEYGFLCDCVWGVFGDDSLFELFFCEDHELVVVVLVKSCDDWFECHNIITCISIYKDCAIITWNAYGVMQ